MVRNVQLVLPSIIMMVFVPILGAVAEGEIKPLARTNHLKIVGLPKHVRTGEDISLEAITTANAKCIITVASDDQELIGSDLVPKIADSSGKVKWQFKAIDHVGKLQIYVHSVSGVADVGASTAIEVQSDGKTGN